ncbi:MAG TPA: HYR domain-containing protein [Lacunisphaera sp.]
MRASDELVSDRLGIAHTGGKYWLTGENYLNEGALRIQEMGGRVVKIFMGANYASQFPWNSNWPAVGSLVELAQTPHFQEFFSRPSLTTYVIDATEFGPSIYWKDGMSEVELQNSYSEIRALAVHLLSTYSNKTFIIQNWEGDNAFGNPPDIAVAEQGMADWLNVRQLAVDDARTAVLTSTSKVYGAAEFNFLPPPFMQTAQSHLIINTVIPNTNMDLYSISNYLTGQNDGREDIISAMLDYMDLYCPDSLLFGRKNLYFGEFGAKENSLGSDPLQRQVAGRQIEQAFKWGARYVIFWAIYDNVLKNGVTLAPGQEATNSQLLGNWLIRPDGTLPQINTYFRDILGRSYATYQDRYEFEQAEADSPTNDPFVVSTQSGASGGYLVRFDANAANDEIHCALQVPVAGTYDMEIGYKTGTDAGIIRVFVAGVATGDQIDTYAASPVLSSSKLSVPITFTKAGLKDFKFRSRAKNTSSSGFRLYLDYVRLIPVGRDTTAPTLTVPDSVTVEATSATGAIVNYPAASATDDVGVTSLAYSRASGSPFPLGVTAVIVSASDAAGNTSSGSFTVNVTDTTAPSLTVPANLTVEASSAAGAVVNYPAATATDAVGVTTLTYSKAAGTTFPLGLTTVTVTAKDAAGNTSSGSFTVNVTDTTAPSIVRVVPSQATLWSPNHRMEPISISVEASDAVGMTGLRIISVASNEPDDGLGDGDMAGDSQITGDLTVNLRAERSGKGTGRIYTIVVEARDAAGNVGTSFCTVAVPKSQGGK